jgi:hypothetical protein
LARTLVLMSAAMGLIGLTDSASTPKIENSHHTHLNTPQHWQEMKLDEYLLTYPNGEVLSLSVRLLSSIYLLVSPIDL